MRYRRPAPPVLAVLLLAALVLSACDGLQGLADTQPDATSLPTDRARDYIDWTILPTIDGPWLEFEGRLKQRHRDAWTLCATDFERMAIYKWPHPLFGYESIDPIGSVVEPLEPGYEWTSPLPPEDVEATRYAVDCTGFDVRVRISPEWGESFSVGVWGKHRDSNEWAHLGEQPER